LRKLPGVTSLERVDARRDRLRAAALELGFDAAAWVSAAPLERDVNAFSAWCASEHHAGMDYLPSSLERRANAESTFSGAGAALVLMVSHNHPAPTKPAGGTRLGRVARYAWSRDYHQALQPALHALERAALLEGVRAKAFVDHAPLLERGYAVRAGLGWRGRSSQTISTALGALTSLAVLLCDLPAPVDAEHPDRCGRCTACVRACPTDAILPERAVDSRRCIAYYTVEHRGSVPVALRAGFGDHLFGCDDCLDVCPWTTHAGRFSGLLEPDPELAHPDLEPLFTESGHAFLRRYAHSAFARARRRGMARNAAIVLGNTRDPAHAGLLARGSSDGGWEVREAVAWALGRVNAGQVALERLCQDTDERVAHTARLALEGAFLEA
jgi:epoxyqueuosine reductase